MEESNLEIKCSLKMNISFLTVMRVGSYLSSNGSAIRSCLQSAYKPKCISFETYVKVLAIMMVSQGQHNFLKLCIVTWQHPKFSLRGLTSMHQKLFLALLFYNFKTEIVSLIFFSVNIWRVDMSAL